MSGEPKTYEVEVEGGKFYVKILAADRDARSHWEGDKRIEREEIKGRVQVATDAEFKGHVAGGYVKVRGRKHATLHTVSKIPDLAAKRLGSAWHCDSTYTGGYHNDRGQRVKTEAKAYDTLRRMEREALDKFAEQNPDWERESTRLLFERKRDTAITEKRRYELAADQQDIQAAVWQKRIEDLMSE
ncbi:hypothetical protein OH733_05260 [Streptomyces griseus]|uniref:hypothetical protein n=1 Tax=Streptomyces griseus TaxID=1911 RepID=UPI00386FC0D0|nr:hypothetical protein OH733_05260 [Streptomyces griseus]WTD71193.1 hypothetical protein OH763_31725 [Streptomyces griseus]